MNSLRYLLTISWLLLGAYIFEFANIDLFLCSLVMIPELVLFSSLAFIMRSYITFNSQSFSYSQMYLRFGVKGMWTGALTEVNSKIDLLFLTHFLGANVAGLYSVPAMIFEGVYQLPSVFRNILNPKIARLYKSGDFKGLSLEMSSMMRMSLITVPLLCLVAIFLFPIYTDYLIGNSEYRQGFLSVAILLGAVSISAYWLPAQMFLIQIGFPGYQSLFLFATVVLNVLLNIILIPQYGMAGAALGTAGATVFSSALNVLVVRYILRRKLASS